MIKFDISNGRRNTLYIDDSRRVEHPIKLSTYELSIDLSRGVFPFIDALTGCRALSRKEKRDREGGDTQPRHSGFVPLIVPDNSLPSSRYVNLSSADTYLSLLVRNCLKLFT